jgi:phosphotransferase system enzyme I (PtsP)
VALSAPRRLLARLRDLMAHDPSPLPQLVRLVAGELVSEVCSVYALRPGDILELVATEGLRAEAVGHTRLRVGEGIIGLVAATGQALNLPDAQHHPAFAYRPETGEESYASMLAVPVRRAGRTLGVLAVQNRMTRRYDADEIEVMETVAMLLAEGLAALGASDGAVEGLAANLPRRFEGTGLVPGVAIGPVVRLGVHLPPRTVLADDPDWETGRLARALRSVQVGLDELIAENLPTGEAPREILEAYRLVAADQGWVRRAGEAIRGGLSAEAAVHRVAGELHDRMRRVTDPYLRERLADLEDLAARLLAALDEGAPAPAPPPGAILLARRLGPAQLLDWHARGIVGFAVEEGSAAGHAAIIARALGLPALGGVRGVLDTAEDGDEAVLDADEEQLVLRPEQAVRDTYQRLLGERAARQAGWAELRGRPGITRDGVPLRLMLNMGLALELEQLEATGADGVGLFRTEIAMLARGELIGVAEQAEIYSRVLDAASGRPVLFRTLDLGGDKLLPGSEPDGTENPAMGWRSLRVGLDRPALLRRQLRALLLAAAGRPLSVMFPFVATVAEFRAARALLVAEAQRVAQPPARLEVGTMLEVPALLWQLPALLMAADFVSIGTNDLMQFLFAADRGTPALAHRYDPLSPPVLDILEHVFRQAEAAGVPVSVCGEMAARPLEAMTLAALGLTSLSMPATALPPLKAFLAELDLTAFRPVLASIRRNAEAAASLREPIAAWAREYGLAA